MSEGCYYKHEDTCALEYFTDITDFNCKFKDSDGFCIVEEKDLIEYDE